MHYLNLPAGSAVRLQASARADVSPHHWDIRVLEAGSFGPDAEARLTYGPRSARETANSE